MFDQMKISFLNLLLNKTVLSCKRQTVNKKIKEILLTSSNPKVQNILNNFNFELVHNVMVNTNWKWGIGKDAKIPSVDDLKVEAVSLLERCYAERVGTSTGGFEVDYNVGNDYEILTLKFVLEEWFEQWRQKCQRNLSALFW